MPIYNFITFWFRFAGIINSIRKTEAGRQNIDTGTDAGKRNCKK